VTADDLRVVRRLEHEIAISRGDLDKLADKTGDDYLDEARCELDSVLLTLRNLLRREGER